MFSVEDHEQKFFGSSLWIDILSVLKNCQREAENYKLTYEKWGVSKSQKNPEKWQIFRKQESKEHSRELHEHVFTYFTLFSEKVSTYIKKNTLEDVKLYNFTPCDHNCATTTHIKN